MYCKNITVTKQENFKFLVKLEEKSQKCMKSFKNFNSEI